VAADVVDLSGRRVEQEDEARSATVWHIAGYLQELLVMNDRGQLRGLVVVATDTQGVPHTWKVWCTSDQLAILGELDVVHAEMMARILATRHKE
jgi:hypothetical protein